MTVPAPVNFSIDLKGRTALVTGASAGLGRRFASVLAMCGAKVAIIGRRLDKLEELAAEIAAAGGVALPVAFDIARVEDIPGTVELIQSKLGVVDILVNNAGIPDASRAIKLKPEKALQVLDINLRAPWTLSTEVARRLIEAGQTGRIVNIASMGAFISGPDSAASLYATTKGAIVRMSEVLALEWARFGINVNAIAPGAFSSEMMDGMIERIGDDFVKTYPRKRLGQPEQLDSTLLFLVSPSSEFVTGTCIKVDDAQVSR